MKRFLPITLFLCVSCAVGPNYKAPQDEITGSWEVKESQDVAYTDPSQNWWEEFHDALLSSYIQSAQEHNYDVLVATSTIMQARALRKMTASSFYPQVTSNVNGTKTYFSKNGPAFTFGTETNTPGIPFTLQVPQIQSLYNILFDATWEIDVFGKTRRAVESADALIGRAIEEKNDVLVTVTAEVARNYIELRVQQEQKRLTLERIALLEIKKGVIRDQFQSGYVNRLDEENIEAIAFSEEAKLPGIEAQIYQSIYILSTLIGKEPETLLDELLVEKPLPEHPKVIKIGAKTDLLRRRPDIRRAERNLAAQTAAIGVAVAQFFPSFSLFGDAGLQSLALNNLFSLGSKTWDYGGGFTLPIFQGGLLVGNLHAKQEQTISASYVYQQTVLKALQEAQSSLMNYTQDLKALRSQTQSLSHTENLVKLSDERHVKGLTNLIDLIDAKLDYNTSKKALLDSKSATLFDLIILYKVLGGNYS